MRNQRRLMERRKWLCVEISVVVIGAKPIETLVDMAGSFIELDLHWIYRASRLYPFLRASVAELFSEVCEQCERASCRVNRSVYFSFSFLS